jgi:sulfate adenylyltransferase subunit 1 (EFTu-like GTPase family)
MGGVGGLKLSSAMHGGEDAQAARRGRGARVKHAVKHDGVKTDARAGEAVTVRHGGREEVACALGYVMSR